MKKILLSLGSLVFAGALVAGGTGAVVYSQTISNTTIDTSTVHLTVDNESYVTNNAGNLVASASTSWSAAPLAGHTFFNFGDVKPGDVGEDTISLHVDNSAWACMDIALASTTENSVNEPELTAGDSATSSIGELQNALQFVFWANDGDNVYEQGEKIFKEGSAQSLFDGSVWTLADAGSNIWTSVSSSPIHASSTVYIGKTWCFGTLTKTPLPQDGHGKTGSNGPLIRGTGFGCSGTTTGNEYQSDGLSLDVSFNALQSRDNASYRCDGTSIGTSTPPLDFQHCSPGYWKQSQHFDGWVGYSPNQQFSSVFDNAFPGMTLLQVLQQGGGGLNELGRATVAALLDASSANAPFSPGLVINMFDAAYPGTNVIYGALTHSLSLLENCPLN